MFDSFDNRAFGALRSISLELAIMCREGDCLYAWDDYDLKALPLAAWQESLGEPITRKSYLTR